MPRKAMKCIVEVDLIVVTCPGTFLRDFEYAYVHMEMLGLEARTKSVPPTFPLFYHERLRFERTFLDVNDPGLVSSMLKSEDVIIELRQHTDYIHDGKVIAHCSSNTHDFLYPAIPPYYGSGREILLYKTAKFKPIRVTGESVKLEFTTQTIIKEVTDYNLSDGEKVLRLAESHGKPTKSILKKHNSFSGSKSIDTMVKDAENDFVIRKNDDKVLSNRDFSTYVSPKPRRSMSPVRSSSMQRSASPRRSKTVNGGVSVESLPVGRYLSPMSTSVQRHRRSVTNPLHNSTINSLSYALDDLELAETRRHHRRRYRTLTSPHLIKALNSSRRIQERVDGMLYTKELLDSDIGSDVGLDILRSTLREERNALNDAIKQADQEAFFRTFNKTY